MSIELNRDARERATTSLQAYVRDELDVEIGSIAAGCLLDYFLEDIAPRMTELDISLGKLEYPLSRRTDL